MTTDPNHRSTSSNQKDRTRGSGRRKKWRIAIFALEGVVLLALVGLLLFVFINTDGGNGDESGPTIVEVASEPSDLEIDSSVQENEAMQGYWNIALFGIDATSDSELVKGARSDCIIIASINMDTGDIKLVSVYRDTFLNIGSDYYIKCNTAYSRGGGEQAIIMLNANLDLDITDFIAISYEGLITIVDGLGGIWVDVDEEEIKHINNYQISISETLGGVSYTPVTSTGYQLLDGMQTAAYCRIRYKTGDDFARAASQREVIQAIVDRAYDTDVATLTNVLTSAMNYVVTTLTVDDLIPYLSLIGDYRIVDEDGFPQSDMRTVANIGSKGSSVIPLDLESNVQWLHKFLFDEDDYQVSDKVREYSREISYQTAAYRD